MSNELQKADHKENNNIQLQSDAPPMVQVAQLLASGVDIDVDKMAKIQEMAERYESNMARKAFFDAMSTAQAEIEGVCKTKKNSQTNSMYATLDNVIEVSKPIYTKHGFSVTFSEGKPDTQGDIRVCADVLHKDGHERSYHYDLAIDDKGPQGKVNKTSVHGKASSVSYGRRYLMCMIWNISTPDQDGNSAPANTEPEAIEWTDARLNFAGIIKRELEDALDGEPIKLEEVKKFIACRHRTNPNKPIPEDPKDANFIKPTVKFLLSNHETLNRMKG